MAISYAELLKLRRYTKEEDKQRFERYYKVTGTNDPALAMTCGPDIGDSWGNLTVTGKEVEVVDWSLCRLKITYEEYSDAGQQPGASETEFDTAAQSYRITKALAQATAGMGGLNPGLMIGIPETGSKPEGVDVYFPTYTHVETHWRESCNYTYRAMLYALTGTINKYGWKMFNVAEALFLGATGRKYADGKWQVVYRFGGRPSEQMTVTLLDGSTIGPFTKRGWDYIWYTHGATASGAGWQWGITTVSYALVYPEKDFSLLGIGV